MPRKRSDEDQKPDALDLIAKLLAVHLVKGMEKDAAAAQLGGIGFGDKAVAEMVGISESAVRGIRFRAKKSSRRRKKK